VAKVTLRLLGVYCSPVEDVTTDHGVHYHQYADDTQIHLATSADNTTTGLSACSADARQWYIKNDLQLNPDNLRLSLSAVLTVS